MIQSPLIKLSIAAGLMLSLAACTKIRDVQGTTVDLYPIQYSLEFDMNRVKQQQSEAQLDQFIEYYWDLIVTQPVTLTAFSPQGKKLAEATQTKLLKRGIEAGNIHVNQQLDMAPYDFQIAILKHKVVVQDCPYHSIGNYDQGAEGCYVERLRWTSITRPERMATQQDKSVHSK